MNDLKIIIDKLYKKNFVKIKKSEVSSSHWDDYTKKLNVVKLNFDYQNFSYGIAQFTKKNFASTIKSIPRKLYIFYLYYKYINEKKIYKKISNIANKTNILIEFDQIRHGIILKILKSKINFNNNKYICLIGDGHGFFGTLIKEYFPNSKIIFINLGRNLFLDAFYLKKFFGEKKSILLEKNYDVNINKYQFIFIEAENYELLSKLPIFLFINIASMQEMDNKVINKYFTYIRSNPFSNFFYCCNRISKTLPDLSNIKFDNYPWKESDKVLIEEICKWYMKYPISRYPFLKKFDGLMKHKLIELNNE